MQYEGARRPLREIARALEVDVFMEGAVLTDGGNVQVAARLVDASSDMKFWVEDFESAAGDLRGLQRQIARSIGAAIQKRYPRQR